MNCALITGASKGIGRAIALQLAKDHHLHILINYSADTTQHRRHRIESAVRAEAENS